MTGMDKEPKYDTYTQVLPYNKYSNHKYSKYNIMTGITSASIWQVYQVGCMTSIESCTLWQVYKALHNDKYSKFYNIIKRQI